jgi:hypothetical protein
VDKELEVIFTADINDLEVNYFRGDKWLLLEAVRRCGQYGIAWPCWVREAYEAALVRYQDGKARTLDEAFGIERKKGQRMHALATRTRKDYTLISLQTRLYDFVEECRKTGAILSEEGAFADAAEKFQISPALVRTIYREVQKIHDSAKGT